MAAPFTHTDPSVELAILESIGRNRDILNVGVGVPLAACPPVLTGSGVPGTVVPADDPEIHRP
jgi:hypothetical protein